MQTRLHDPDLLEPGPMRLSMRTGSEKEDVLLADRLEGLEDENARVEVREEEVAQRLLEGRAWRV